MRRRHEYYELATYIVLLLVFIIISANQCLTSAYPDELLKYNWEDGKYIDSYTEPKTYIRISEDSISCACSEEEEIKIVIDNQWINSHSLEEISALFSTMGFLVQIGVHSHNMEIGEICCSILRKLEKEKK